MPGIWVSHGICRACQTLVASEYWLRDEQLAAGLTIEVEDYGLRLKHGKHTIALVTTPRKGKAILQAADKYLHFQSV
jgi:hypothetical protein